MELVPGGGDGIKSHQDACLGSFQDAHLCSSKFLFYLSVFPGSLNNDFRVQQAGPLETVSYRCPVRGLSWRKSSGVGSKGREVRMWQSTPERFLLPAKRRLNSRLLWVFTMERGRVLILGLSWKWRSVLRTGNLTGT